MSAEKNIHSDNSLSVSSEAVEFSWSYSRCRIFKFCKRAYFYRYYAANNGWDKFADPYSRVLYRLKNLVKTENYVRNLVSKTLSDVFTRGSKRGAKDFPLRDIYSALQKHIFHNRADIENRCWEEDPKKLNLFEVYYGEDPDLVFGKIREHISDFVSKLSQCGLLSELASVPYLQWKNFTLPVVFSFNGLNVWTAPDFVWSHEGHTNLLFLKSQRDEEAWRIVPGVSVMALENNFHKPPSLCKCRTFFREGPEIFEGYESLEKVRSIIMESSSSMLSLLTGDGKANEESFNRAEGNCPSCEFKEYCGK